MKNAYQEDSLIIWQKWFDPFGSDDHQQIEKIDDEIEDESEDKEFYSDESISKIPMRAIATPMGVIPYTENTASGKIFNFWIGHTNFNVSEAIATIIENTDGVEILDIFTRYRFRIAIGKSFDSSKVMKEINDNVYHFLE